MRKYIFDIDGTICTHRELGDYENAEPYIDRIAFVNGLYDEGHNITYWTARGSSSGKDWRNLTYEQLKKWGCKYHELRFDKPYYDVWVDDKAFNADYYFILAD